MSKHRENSQWPAGIGPRGAEVSKALRARHREKPAGLRGSTGFRDPARFGWSAAQPQLQASRSIHRNIRYTPDAQWNAGKNDARRSSSPMAYPSPARELLPGGRWRSAKSWTVSG